MSEHETGRQEIPSNTNVDNQALPQDKPELAETEIAKTECLLEHIIKTEVDSFQEYGYISVKSGKGFTATRGNHLGHQYPQETRSDDLVNSDKYKGMMSRASSVTSAFEDEFGLKEGVGLNSLNESRREKTLFCLIGTKGSDVIVQGAGKIHPDMVGRPCSTGFKVVFDSQDPANEFLEWLKENPNKALSSIFEKTTATYSSDGVLAEPLLPQGKVYTGGRGSTNPFALPIKELQIKSLGVTAITKKNFEGEEWYKQVMTERDQLYEAERKLRASSYTAPTASPRFQPVSRPLQQNNPSPGGLNPDAPLTKIINYLIKPFSKK